MNNISNEHIELGGRGIGRRKLLDYEMSNWDVPVKPSFTVDKVKWSKSPRRQSSRLPLKIFPIQFHDFRVLCLIKPLRQENITDNVCFQLSSIFTQNKKNNFNVCYILIALLKNSANAMIISRCLLTLGSDSRATKMGLERQTDNQLMRVSDPCCWPLLQSS